MSSHPAPRAVTVVLLHGLHRTRYSMRKMERRLRREGFRTINLGYPTSRCTVEQLAKRVERELLKHDLPEGDPIHFVTHSMGGIVVRALAQRPTCPAIGRVVMLAPPNRGSEIADRLDRTPVLRSVFAKSRRQLRTGASGLPEQLGPAPFEAGVIAGTRRQISAFGKVVPSPCDGTVSVASTKLEGMADFVTVDCGHTFIQNDAAVMNQTVRFLRTGRFDDGPGAPRSYFLG